MPIQPKTGQHVRHKVFGDGKVLVSYPRSSVIRVAFDSGIERDLLWAMALKNMKVLKGSAGSKKPRKAPAKKVRKVRMHFFRDSDGDLLATQWKKTAKAWHHAQWGRSFSQIVSEPIASPKTTKKKGS